MFSFKTYDCTYKKDVFKTTAYTKKYYVDDTVNVMYESVDYLLDNLRELEELFSLFTEERIVADDMKRENAILGKEGIVLINPDTYSFSLLEKEEIAIQNKTKEIYYIFLEVFVTLVCGSILTLKNYSPRFIKI